MNRLIAYLLLALGVCLALPLLAEVAAHAIPVLASCLALLLVICFVWPGGGP